MINYITIHPFFSSSFNEKLISNWIKNVAKKYKKETGSITYIFCDDEKILDLNKQYLEHNYYTDIISFDYSKKNRISGDIFISIDTVKSNANSLDIDFQEELYRVMIHGVLHLCGLKDSTPTEEKKMRKAENQALKELTNLLQENG